MPWAGGVYTRTNGTYNGATVWASDAAAAVKIQSSRHDTHDQDLATGINACVAKDGSNTVTALNLTATVNATTGVITIGGVNFANMFNPGTNYNVFVGGAGNFTTTGYSNYGIGINALQNVSSGLENAAYGIDSLNADTTGYQNSAYGPYTLQNNVGGNRNAALGGYSLQYNTSGSFNTAVGFAALPSNTTGSYNIGIGYSCDVPSATASGQLSIQNAIYGTGNTGTNASVSTGNIGLYTTAPTARLHLPAGTATAGTSPLKLTAGTNLTTPENGAIEFDGTHLYITIGGARKTII